MNNAHAVQHPVLWSTFNIPPIPDVARRRIFPLHQIESYRPITCLIDILICTVSVLLSQGSARECSDRPLENIIYTFQGDLAKYATTY